MLCNEHNYERLNGKSRQEVYSERAAAKPLKIYKLKTYSKPIQQTKKERKAKQKLSVVKTNLELEAVQNGEYYCKGCGISYPGLDKSHILSVGQRKDLETDPLNMRLHCRSCHMDWESWEIDRMARLNCFESDLDYIFHHDSETFAKICTKMQEFLRFFDENTHFLAKKMKKILKKYCQTVA